MYTDWNCFIQQLFWFTNTYGHLNIPDVFPENQILATTARVVRTKKMLGLLAKNKFDELNDIGFVWITSNRRWEQNLFDFKEFNQKTGHFNVPWKYNQRLYSWLKSIKSQYRNNTLSEEKIRALKMLGVPVEEW